MTSALLRSPFKRTLMAAVLFGSLSAAAANATTIDFGSVPQESANGVTLGDVTFGYTEFGSASPEAVLGVNVGTGAAQNVQGTTLFGPTDGVLTLSFATPIRQLAFGILETTNLSLTPGFSVSVFNAAGHLIESANIDANPLVAFSEGEFTYNGDLASSVVISFDATDANDFALGAITYSVPEPADFGIFGLGLIGLGATIMRRRQV